ncbi:MAG: penicillin-binding protein 1A [Firmicutes bacterium]|nr:penicillin-binding protein 1A [Bacillota bacterium]
MAPRTVKKRKISKGRLVVLILLLLGIVIGGLGCGLVVASLVTLPEWDPDKLDASQTSYIYDYKGELAYQLHEVENREDIKLSKIPPLIQQAVIATEDDRFYQHIGVNPLAIARAAVANVTSGFGSQGGSTITQQLVKQIYFSKGEKTLQRKIQEAILAIKLERQYTKDEILEMYLNRIYFGEGAWGIKMAAKTYFGKDLEKDRITLGEAAMLAGLIQSPGTYDPYKYPDAAKRRRAIVLSRMVELGYISPTDAHKASEEEFILNKNQVVKSAQRYQYFVDHVIDETDKILTALGTYDNPEDIIYKGGLKIYTTLDQKIQAAAEDVYSQDSYFPPSKKDKIVQSAMVVLDPHTGQIKAIVGGRNYAQKRGFNRATDALRQPGSSIKPITVYAPALVKGYTPATVLDDTLTSYKSAEGTWTPRNYDDTYRGLIRMRTAVQYSINTYAVKLLNQIGVGEGVKFAEQLGITSLVKSGPKNDVNLASMALGGLTKGVTPLEMAGAYTAFANQGIYVKPFAITKIVDRNGKVLFENRVQQRRVMTPQVAYLMTNLLETVVQSGTATSAQLDRPVAGKTGTTDDDSNAWFVGYTPDLLAAVWLGYDNQTESMRGVYGGNYAAKIWRAVMAKAHANIPPHTFTMPEGLTTVTVCAKSGLLPSALCPEKDLVQEIFPADNVPTQTCNVHVQAEICPESGQLATIYCPTKITGVFIKRTEPYSSEKPPLDAKEELPRQSCPLHGPNAGANNGSSPTTDTGNQTGLTVTVCVDPRHRGQIFLANRPGPNQSGGCPSQYVQERVLPTSQVNKLKYCDLPEHKIR